jgi:ABC-type multidrug transport system fused ATPase/permease subunit
LLFFFFFFFKFLFFLRIIVSEIILRIFDLINETTLIEHDNNDPINTILLNTTTKNLTHLKTHLSQKLTRSKPNLIGKIQFKNVWFRFPTRSTFTLKGLSFTTEPNSNYAIVGASGSGKSTIFQLLLRFYDPDQGEILIDGIDIKTIDLEHLRDFFGFIKQEPELFNGSLKYNIQYNRYATQLNEIEDACDTSNSTEFIELHSEGIERDLGNRGDVLSGGQRQRIAIARVLLRRPKVFLFDEATSALDANSEKIVQSAIDSVTREHASISIAHRFSTIENVDCVFVIDKGKVAEQGSYGDLMKRKGVFYRLSLD